MHHGEKRQRQVTRMPQTKSPAANIVHVFVPGVAEFELNSETNATNSKLTVAGAVVRSPQVPARSAEAEALTMIRLPAVSRR
jgi:hypothetical protein